MHELKNMFERSFCQIYIPPRSTDVSEQWYRTTHTLHVNTHHRLRVSPTKWEPRSVQDVLSPMYCGWQMQKVFTNRWSVFNTPVTTVTFTLHPEFCRRDKLQYEEMRIVCQSGSQNLHSDMNDQEPGAFHTDCMVSDNGKCRRITTSSSFQWAGGHRQLTH
jgi:hypothetical protein